MLIGITTSPRQTRYLCQTVFELIASSVGSDQIVIAPNFKDPDENWQEIALEGVEILPPLIDRTLDEHNTDLGLNDKIPNRYKSEHHHHGIQLNTDNLMRQLAGRPGGDWFITAQDDLICCRRAVERMNAVANHLRNTENRVGAVSFYSPYEEFSRQGTALVPYPPGKFYGEVCLLWRREAALDFVAQSVPDQAHDLQIQAYFNTNSRFTLMAHYPCLVQHVGLDSARGDGMHGTVQTMHFWRRMDAMNGIRL